MNASTLSKKSLSVWAVAISFAIALFACGFASSAHATTALGKVDTSLTATSENAAQALANVDDNLSMPTTFKHRIGDGAYVKLDYDAATHTYLIKMYKAKLSSGSITVKNGYNLKITNAGTCYINGGVSANTVTFNGKGTLYVKGGILADTMNVSRNLTSSGATSSKSFTLKSYNTRNDVTAYGINTSILNVTCKAKVYAKGYSSDLDASGIYCDYININKSAYAKGSGKRFGVDVFNTINISSGSLYGSSTYATADTDDYPCTGIYTECLYSKGGTVSGTASGKGSAGLFIASNSNIQGTVKGYGKNYGYGIIQTNKDFVVNGGKVTAYGGNTAITTTRNVVLNNATVYAYGRKSTSTKSKYRIGNGIAASGSISIVDSKVIAVAKSSTSRYALLSNSGNISISGKSTVSLTGKKGYVAQAPYGGISWVSPAIVKRNGSKVTNPDYPVTAL